jgi:ABC-type bacteriocin/lantibiotic exporter with double-glycine peptidase domain
MVMAPMALLSILLLLALGGRLESTVSQTRQRRGKLANTVAEQVVNIENLTAHGRVAKERGRLEQRSRALGEALQRRAFWIGCLRAATELTQKILLIVVLVVSARALTENLLDPASLIALVTVTALLATPLRDLGRVTEYWKNAQVARRKIAELLQPLTTPPVRLKKLVSGDGDLLVQNLQIGGMLSLPELHVSAGQRLAISGENGAGKSTLLKAFAGLVTPVRGSVALDGVATNRLSPADRRRAVGFAGQQMPLTAGSISKNVRYRLPGANAEEVDRAIRLAGLEEFLRELPEGLNTRIGGRRQLSAGEQARVMLARAVIGRPRLLLFDEIDANLDASGRLALKTLLRTYPGTVVFVSHDSELIGQADVCCLLQGGEVIVSKPERRELKKAVTA